LLREAASKDTPEGIYIKEKMNSGELVDNELTIKLLEEKLKSIKASGFILDGFPRDLDQAKKLDQIMDEIEKDVPNANGEIGTGCLIVGTGVSQPNIKDAFDEKIGNNIAFMKAKLNANIKKRNVLRKLWEASMITINAIDEEWSKIDNMIALDLNGLRRYNAEYLNYLDEFGYEIQEEIEEPGCED
jgi:hypothetical protein